MITFYIDELTPCLKNTTTGEIFETEFVRFKRKSLLSKYNKKTGWYVNWSKFDDAIEIYALLLKGTFDVQGLIALENRKGDGAIHVVWACTAPENNLWKYGAQNYKGVGGHLLSYAGQKSLDAGYGGVIYGEAVDEELFNYYIDNFKAEAFPYGYPPHPYRFAIGENEMRKMMEVYNYDDTGEEY